MPRPDFRNADVVMVCHHIFEDARRGKLSIDWHQVQVDSLELPKTFRREDGTTGHANYFIRCAACEKLPAREVDYIEEFWSDGRLHVADFCR